jgi:hypothetical protein
MPIDKLGESVKFPRRQHGQRFQAAICRMVLLMTRLADGPQKFFRVFPRLRAGEVFEVVHHERSLAVPTPPAPPVITGKDFEPLSLPPRILQLFGVPKLTR